MKNWIAVVSLGVAASFAVSAIADDFHNGQRQKRAFRAELVGLNEVPAVSTQASGTFYAVVNEAETELRYWLTYSGQTGDTTQSHIHVGAHHTNGGISVWLCEGTLPSPSVTTPACTPGTTIEGLITSTEVIGPVGQGITAGEFAELLAAMRAGVAYANVHSTTFGSGEIRGQIR